MNEMDRGSRENNMADRGKRRMMKFGETILNKVSPELSALTQCGAPEIAGETDDLIILHVRDVVGGQSYKEPYQVLIAMLIARVSNARSEYRRGRANLLRYVDTLPEGHDLTAYIRALGHFENCILQTHVAITCLIAMGKIHPKDEFEIFSEKDSDYARLRGLNNRIKHFEEDVREAAKRGLPIDRSPLWITNEGLIANDGGKLSFVELAGILDAQNQDSHNFAHFEGLEQDNPTAAFSLKLTSWFLARSRS
jgi:hypothetical protein